jgi:Viral BACON domain
VYQAQVQINAPGALFNPTDVIVQLVVSTGRPPFSWSVTPKSLIFTAGPGTQPPTQTIAITTSTGAPLNFSVSDIEPADTRKWLTVSPSSGTTPANLSVSVNGALLPMNTGATNYYGTIQLSPDSSANCACGIVQIPVTVNAVQGNPATALTTNPQSLTFSTMQGSTQAAEQDVQIFTQTPGTPFSIGTAGTSWLTATPANGKTPAVVHVQVRAQALATGHYTANISVQAQSGTTLQVPVNLNVTSPSTNSGPGGGTQLFDVQAPSLQFTVNGSQDASQQLAQVLLATNRSSTNLDLTARSKNNSAWVAITSAGGMPGTTPVTISPGQSAQYQVRVIPHSLPGGLLQAADSLLLSGGGQTRELPIALAVSGSSGPQPLLSTTSLTLFTTTGHDWSDRSDILLYNAAALQSWTGTPAPGDSNAIVDETPRLGINLPASQTTPITVTTQPSVAELPVDRSQAKAQFPATLLFVYDQVPTPDMVTVYVDVLNSATLPPSVSTSGILVGIPGQGNQTVSLSNKVSLRSFGWSDSAQRECQL